MSDLKKLPHKLNDEDLLKILEDVNNLEVVEKAPEHSVTQFLADFGIYPGVEKVRGDTLYKLYYRHTETPVSTVEFHLLLRGYVESSQNISGSTIYHLNKKSSDLTKILAEYLEKKRYNKKIHNRHYRNRFDEFLKAFSVKTGTKIIHPAVLYFFYDKWQYTRKHKTVLSYKTFISFLKLFFKTYRTSTYWCLIKIDTETFYKQFTEQEIITAQRWAEKFSEYDEKSNRWKKKPKIKNSVPSSET